MLTKKIPSTSTQVSLAKTDHIRPTELQPDHYVPQRDKLGVDQQKLKCIQAAVNNFLRPESTLPTAGLHIIPIARELGNAQHSGWHKSTLDASRLRKPLRSHSTLQCRTGQESLPSHVGIILGTLFCEQFQE